MARFAATDTPLDANEEIVLSLSGGREDNVVGIVFADQAGTLFIEQSMDNEHWDLSTEFAVTASDGKGFSESVIAPYVRVRYVNGGVAQAEFRLNARFSSSGYRG